VDGLIRNRWTKSAEYPCGGAAKVIACIEDPVVIEKILTHLDEKAVSSRNEPVARKPGAAASGLGQLTLKETHPSTQMTATPTEAAGYLLA
jgi:hypothetical protein